MPHLWDVFPTAETQTGLRSGQDSCLARYYVCSQPLPRFVGAERRFTIVKLSKGSDKLIMVGSETPTRMLLASSEVGRASERVYSVACCAHQVSLTLQSLKILNDVFVHHLFRSARLPASSYPRNIRDAECLLFETIQSKLVEAGKPA